MNEHPTPQRLRDWREGRLSHDERQKIEAHIETCDHVCQPLLDELLDDTSPETAPSAARLGVPDPLSPEGYEILGELGRGGMGVVYKARQRSLDRLVALKMLLLGEQAGPADLARFRAEAEIIARMHHPHIVQVHDIVEHRGSLFLSLEYCPGGTLAARLKDRLPSPTVAAELVELLARAVYHAHQQGVLHRDLKPGNILLVEGPEAPVSRCTPKISDFGLAKRLDLKHSQSLSGDIIGTPSYMAPEQAGGHKSEIGPTADVYGLGAVLYECLTGRPPFRAGQPIDTLLQVISEEPVAVRKYRPKVHWDLETICMKCLEKSPQHRYASALELADDLRRFLEGEAILARPPSLSRRGGRWLRRRAPWVAATAMLLIVSVAIVASLLSVKHSRERDRVAFATARETAKQTLAKFDATKLLGNNSIPLREMQRALADIVPVYEQMLQQQPDDAEARAELALVHVRLGWLQTSMGENEDAIASIEKGCAGFAALADADPGQARYRQAFANAQSDLAFVNRFLQRDDQARAAFLRALQERKRLVAEFPDVGEYDLDLRKEKVDFAGFLQSRGEVKSAAEMVEGLNDPRGLLFKGLLQAQLGRTDEADRTFGESLTLMESMLSPSGPWKQPDSTPQTSTADTKLTELYANKQAVEVYRQIAAFYSPLVAQQPGRPHYRHQLARIYFYHAMTLFAIDFKRPDANAKEALAIIRRAAALYDELLKANPGKSAYALEAARLGAYTAIAVHHCVPAEDPVPWCDRALRILDAATFKDAEKERASTIRVVALCSRAAFLFQKDRPIESVRDYQSAFQLNPKSREEFGTPYFGAVAAARKQLYERLRSGAREQALAGAEALGSIPEIPGEALYDIACVLGSLAGTEKDQDKRQRFETRCVEFLRKAFTTGFGKDAIQKATSFHGDPIEHMKGDADLASVRHRPDYQKLLDDLARTTGRP
jgi:serine/threonine protein kinase